MGYHAVGKDCGVQKFRNAVKKHGSIWNLCDGVGRNRGMCDIRSRVATH
jgi:hypothetical protein